MRKSKEMNKTLEAVDVFNARADEYESKYMDVSLYAESLDIFGRHLVNNTGKVLDIACGPGNVSKYLKDHHPKLQIHGIDLAPNMLSIAEANVPSGSFSIMDCRDINTIEYKFDGITCAFACPYLSRSEVGILINDMASLLNENGILYLSTMEGDKSKSGYQTSGEDQVYINYHQAEYLIETCEESGLKVLNILRVQASQDSDSDIILVAKLK